MCDLIIFKKINFTLEQAVNARSGCSYSSTIPLTSAIDGRWW
jgi:hypothetical protein